MEFINKICSGRMRRGKYFRWSMLVCLFQLPSYMMITAGLAGVGSYVFAFALSTVHLCLTVKRLHDLGHKGTLALLSYVPVVNEIMGFILWLKPGDAGENLYGPSPVK